MNNVSSTKEKTSIEVSVKDKSLTMKIELDSLRTQWDYYDSNHPHEQLKVQMKISKIKKKLFDLTGEDY